MITFFDFYQVVHGRQPFRWQDELAELLANGEWRSVLNLPPSSGKTSIIDIWVYSLYRYTIGRGKRPPLRLWYVVDRRLIVDEAGEHAKSIVEKMPDEMKQKIKDKFRSESHLVAATIRGGLDRKTKSAWLTAPNQPTIITSTVAQYGSRLLFRGYGINRKKRSMQAGLAAVDSLVVLDECHLSEPLAALARFVFASVNEKPMGHISPSRLLKMSATTQEGDAYDLDISDKPLQKRLNAKRPIVVQEGDFLISVGKILDKVYKDGCKVVSVVCNTVKTARRLFERLRKSKKHETILFTGRIRYHERSQIVKKWYDLFCVGRDRANDKPIVMVSTQTIEVGANFDFDAMISEGAPLDCLRQRFGRMDRLGEFGKSQGFIIFSGKEDHVYGETTEATREHLTTLYPDGLISDFGNVPVKPELLARSNKAAEMSDVLINQLVHTNFGSELNIEPLLQGIDFKSTADVSIVYRSEITADMFKDEAGRLMAVKWARMIAPQPQEILNVPVYTLRSGEDPTDSVRIDGSSGGGKPINDFGVCQDGWIVKRLSHAKPGDLFFVPCEFARHDDFGWNVECTDPVKPVLQNVHILRVGKTQGFAEQDVESGNFAEFVDDAKEWTADPTPDGRGLYVHRRQTFEHADGAKQDLIVHLRAVAKWARHFAEVLGLDLLQDVFHKAGYYHDLGKADKRFQQWLYGCCPRNPNKLLAKSGVACGPPIPSLQLDHYHAPKVDDCSSERLMLCYRHELQSAEIIANNGLADGSADPKLLLHLVASHHGWGRGMHQPVVDTKFEPFDVILPEQKLKARESYADFFAKQGQKDFWDLNKKYGHWGLAFLEAVLQLADWRGSRTRRKK